jgi:hypothetical protein
MADSRFHSIGRWAAVALCAATMALAHARPLRDAPGAGHGGGPFAAAPRPLARLGPGVAHRAAPRPLGPRVFAQAPHAAIPLNPYRLGANRIPPMAANVYQPVSENTRSAGRGPDGAVYMRAGSIREDIARYNEERENGRAPQRPPAAGPHAPSSLYRN